MPSRRPARTTTSTSKKRSASTSGAKQGPAKKARSDWGPHAVEEPKIPDASQLSTFSSAFDIAQAIENKHRIPRIGRCIVRDVDTAEGEPLQEEDVVSPPPENDPETAATLEKVKELHALLATDRRTYASGRLKDPIRLKINLADYKFDEIMKLYERPRFGESTPDKELQASIDERLAIWLEHGAVSPFGDMREHVTKVDTTVREAREIRADEFEVSDSLIQEIESIWAENFTPSAVRAEPYKINIYGKGGMFKAHRDTPEKDLVGTFLVGLGDTSYAYEGNLKLYPDSEGKKGKQFRSSTGSWVAFYPDLPHEVTKLHSGHRATLAFKIFRDTKNPSNDELSGIHVPDNIRSAISDIISDVRLPFGLILDHRYSFGTTELSGLDAVLFECVKARSKALGTRRNKSIKTLLIPIIFHEQTIEQSNHVDRTTTQTWVMPFTREVIVEVLGLLEEDREGYDARRIPSWQWLKDVPFFELNDCAVKRWSKAEQEINYTGNESDGLRTDSVYFSYALLCLDPETEMPKT